MGILELRKMITNSTLKMLLLVSLLWLGTNIFSSAQVFVEVSKATWGSSELCLSAERGETPEAPHPTCPFENLCLSGLSVGFLHSGLNSYGHKIPLFGHGKTLKAFHSSVPATTDTAASFQSRAPPQTV